MLAYLRRITLDTWLAAGVACGTLALLVATLDHPLITWDEGFTIEREEWMRKWFALLTGPRSRFTREQLISEPVLQEYWRFARQEPDGHPPFYAMLGNVGWLMSHGWLPELESHRFGPAALFSFTSGVLFAFIARRWGRPAGVAAAGSWLLMPRVFAHAHLASYDAPTACLWFLAVVAFWKAAENWPRSRRAGLGWSVIFAVVLAFGATTKFTGWMIPLPLLLWSAAVAIIELRRVGAAALKRLAPLAIFTAPLVVAAIQVHRFMGDVSAMDRKLQSVMDVDSQQRAAGTARLFRAGTTSRLPLWAVFVPAAAGCGTLIVRRVRYGPTAAQSAASLAETWTVAAALTPPLTVALVPNWWHDPLRGLAIFLWSNLTRQKTTWIPTQFFGDLYHFALPWYNTLAWVFLTVPPLILLLVLAGIVATVLRRPTMEDRASKIEHAGSSPGAPAEDRESSAILHSPSSIFDRTGLAWLLLVNAATLLVIRALPNAPGHDGERLLLGSFPFLACLAGVGAEALRRLLQTRLTPALADWVTRGLVAASLVWAAAAIWHYRSAPLSYYTELVGGVRGAAALGLEPTYYWDSLDAETLDWLNAHTAPDEKVLFCNGFDSLMYLQKWGKLRVGVRPPEPGRWRWFVLQNRTGLIAADPRGAIRWLPQHGKPARPPCELDGVPLIWIFPFEEYERAIRETEVVSGPAGS